jgi:hypothetical protein
VRARLIKWFGGVPKAEFDLEVRQCEIYRHSYEDLKHTVDVLDKQLNFYREQALAAMTPEIGIAEPGPSQQPIRITPISWMRAKRAMEKADAERAKNAT